MGKGFEGFLLDLIFSSEIFRLRVLCLFISALWDFLSYVYVCRRWEASPACLFLILILEIHFLAIKIFPILDVDVDVATYVPICSRL